MELVIEEFGQALLALLAGSAVVAMCLWVLEIASAF